MNPGEPDSMSLDASRGRFLHRNRAKTAAPRGTGKRWICDRVLLRCVLVRTPLGDRTHLMEPTTIGRKGTLKNPEVYENVPGHIIPAITQEFDDFDNEAEKFLDGQTPENEFIGFRLKQGVYGQR